ncbi:hypothetical protein E4U21_007366 [Claviceps maximensis]|nr:hypothetical protein E4U21_007366 [Claviceps maximensis]
MPAAQQVINSARTSLRKCPAHYHWHRHTNAIPKHPHQLRFSAAASHPNRPSPSPSKDIFTLSQIPQSAFESVIAQNANSFNRLSCAEYYAVAQQFAEAIRRGSNPWAVSFSREHGISVETIHAVACIMRQIRSKSANAFAMALWSSASESGHRPSTLSLARHVIRSGVYGRVPQLRGVESRHKQLVSNGRDANALTAEGELLFEQARYDGAATLLRRALRIGAEGEGRTDFEWRPHCELCLGKTYVKLGRVEEAKEVFERLADEGMVEADVELVDLLGKDGGLEAGKEAEQRMYTAACHGRGDMFARLAEKELKKEEDGDGGKTAEERRLWAMEWSRLADQRVEY